MFRSFVCCAWLSSLAALGCKSADDGNKLVSETTVSERVQICKAHKSDLMISIVGGCVLEGIGMSTKLACEQHRDRCLAQPDNGPVKCDMAFHSLDNCMVPKSEFEDCLPQVVSWLKNVSCDNFDKPRPLPPICSFGLNISCPTGITSGGGARNADSGM